MSTSGDESKMAQKSYSYKQSNLNLPIQGGHIAQRTLNVCVCTRLRRQKFVNSVLFILPVRKTHGQQ